MMKLPKEAKEITIAVLQLPRFHWKACLQDCSGRPDELNCVCPTGKIIEGVMKIEEE